MSGSPAPSDRVVDRSAAIVEMISKKNPFAGAKDLPDAPRPDEHRIPRGLSSVDQIQHIQAEINVLSYNHLSHTFFSLEKHRSLDSLLSTGKDALMEALPIRCLEATFVGLYLTQSLHDVHRLPLSFGSWVSGKYYSHIVLVLYVMHPHPRFGALGLSRKSTLMYKPLTYPSLFALIMDYKHHYEALGHRLSDIRLGLSFSHEPAHLSRQPCWRFIALKLSSYVSKHHKKDASPSQSSASLKADDNNNKQRAVPHSTNITAGVVTSALPTPSGCGSGGNAEVGADSANATASTALAAGAPSATTSAFNGGGGVACSAFTFHPNPSYWHENRAENGREGGCEGVFAATIPSARLGCTNGTEKEGEGGKLERRHDEGVGSHSLRSHPSSYGDSTARSTAAAASGVDQQHTLSLSGKEEASGGESARLYNASHAPPPPQSQQPSQVHKAGGPTVPAEAAAAVAAAASAAASAAATAAAVLQSMTARNMSGLSSLTSRPSTRQGLSSSVVVAPGATPRTAPHGVPTATGMPQSRTNGRGGGVGVADLASSTAHTDEGGAAAAAALSLSSSSSVVVGQVARVETTEPEPHPPHATSPSDEVVYQPLLKLLTRYVRLLPVMSLQYHHVSHAELTVNRGMKMCFADLDQVDGDAKIENKRRLHYIDLLLSPLSKESLQAASSFRVSAVAEKQKKLKAAATASADEARKKKKRKQRSCSVSPSASGAQAKKTKRRGGSSCRSTSKGKKKKKRCKSTASRASVESQSRETTHPHGHVGAGAGAGGGRGGRGGASPSREGVEDPRAAFTPGESSSAAPLSNPPKTISEGNVTPTPTSTISSANTANHEDRTASTFFVSTASPQKQKCKVELEDHQRYAPVSSSGPLLVSDKGSHEPVSSTPRASAVLLPQQNDTGSIHAGAANTTSATTAGERNDMVAAVAACAPTFTSCPFSLTSTGVDVPQGVRSGGATVAEDVVAGVDVVGEADEVAFFSHSCSTVNSSLEGGGSSASSGSSVGVGQSSAASTASSGTDHCPFASSPLELN